MNEPLNPPRKILRQLWKKVSHFIGYSAASISSVLVDYAVFSAAIFFGASALLALILGRTFSFVYNYAVLQGWINQGTSAAGRSFPRYLLLTIFSTTAAYLIMQWVRAHAGLPILLIKAIVESGLFFFNYFVSRFWVFRYN